MPTLRRGKPENRTNFERARDAFKKAKGDTRVNERVGQGEHGCPTCGAPMRLIHSYRGKDAYHFEGICTANPDHNVERFGYFAAGGES